MDASDDDRLLGHIEDLRRTFGDVVLTDPNRLFPLLYDKAPDLRTQIRAVVAALASNAPAQVRAAPNTASASAAKIAAENGLSQADAAAGIALAMRVGGGLATPGVAPLPYQRPGATDWIGASQPVGATGRSGATSFLEQQGGVAALARKYKWPLLALGAILLYAANQPTTEPPEKTQAPAPESRPAPAKPGAPQPAQGKQDSLPMLSTTAPYPAVLSQDREGGTLMLVFGVPIPNGALQGVLGVSPKSWQHGKIMFGQPGADAPGSESTDAPFDLHSEGKAILRVLKPQWTRDDSHAGPICVAFIQKGGNDVELHGSTMCIFEIQNGDCAKIVGCGTVS